MKESRIVQVSTVLGNSIRCFREEWNSLRINERTDEFFIERIVFFFGQRLSPAIRYGVKKHSHS